MAPKDKSMAEGKPAIDKELIRELAKLLDETGLTEIEIERAGLRVRVGRGGAADHLAAPAAVSRAVIVTAAPVVAMPADLAKHPGAVTSPMVGTAYRGPAPGAPPFVDIGSKVVGRRDAADHRGDEDHEPDSGAAVGHRHANPDRGRPAGRIRRAAGDHRVSEWGVANSE